MTEQEIAILTAAGPVDFYDPNNNSSTSASSAGDVRPQAPAVPTSLFTADELVWLWTRVTPGGPYSRDLRSDLRRHTDRYSLLSGPDPLPELDGVISPAERARREAVHPPVGYCYGLTVEEGMVAFQNQRRGPARERELTALVEQVQVRNAALDARD